MLLACSGLHIYEAEVLCLYCIDSEHCAKDLFACKIRLLSRNLFIIIRDGNDGDEMMIMRSICIVRPV